MKKAKIQLIPDELYSGLVKIIIGLGFIVGILVAIFITPTDVTLGTNLLMLIFGIVFALEIIIIMIFRLESPIRKFMYYASRVISFFKKIIGFLSKILLKKKLKQGNDQEVLDVFESLDLYNTDEIIHDEYELKVGLNAHLKANLPNFKVKREVKTKRGESIDFVIKNSIGIEVKIAKDNNTLRALIAQTEEYLNDVPAMIVFIFKPKNSNADVGYYKKKLEEKNAYVIVKTGRYISRNEHKY